MQCFCLALSDEEAELDFYVPLDDDGTLNHGGSFVAKPGDAAALASSPRVFLNVVVVAERLDFIKIDVEGHEPSVIAGGHETLRRFRPSILMEIHGRIPLRSAFDPSASVVTLAGLGYRFFDLDRRDDGHWCERVEAAGQ